jgi:hypothetical protein
MQMMNFGFLCDKGNVVFNQICFFLSFSKSKIFESKFSSKIKNQICCAVLDIVHDPRGIVDSVQPHAAPRPLPRRRGEMNVEGPKVPWPASAGSLAASGGPPSSPSHGCSCPHASSHRPKPHRHYHGFMGYERGE